MVYHHASACISSTRHCRVVSHHTLKCDEKEYTIIITRKVANKHTIIHCIDDYIAWEQAPLFPRLVGRSYGINNPIYKFDNDKNNITIFVIKGKPNGIVGLDDGIFRCADNFDDKFINVMSLRKFKCL